MFRISSPSDTSGSVRCIFCWSVAPAPCVAGIGPPAARLAPALGSVSMMSDEQPAPDPGVTGAGGAEGGAGPGEARRKRRSFWGELPVLLAVALAIALLIKTFVVQAFFIPSSSMEDTLLIGDKVLVNKLVYDFRAIEPGDIVVFSGAGSWTPATPAA